MNELLANPAVQGGFAPFLIGLVLAAALRRTRLSGLAVAAAFVVAVELAVGLTLFPLTATRKIVLLGCAAPAVGLLVDFTSTPARVRVALIAVACGLAAIWVFWSILIQKELSESLLLGGGVALFVAAMVGICLAIAREPLGTGTAVLALGLSTGISAMLGASLLYAVYGVAIGAGAGAYLLVQLFTRRKSFGGATLMLPGALISGLLAAGTMVLAKLPWYALPVLALVPVATRMPLPRRMPLWQRTFLRSGSAMIIAAIAFALTWRYAGGGMS